MVLRKYLRHIPGAIDLIFRQAAKPFPGLRKQVPQLFHWTTHSWYLASVAVRYYYRNLFRHNSAACGNLLNYLYRSGLAIDKILARPQQFRRPLSRPVLGFLIEVNKMKLNFDNSQIPARFLLYFACSQPPGWIQNPLLEQQGDHFS